MTRVRAMSAGLLLSTVVAIVATWPLARYVGQVIPTSIWQCSPSWCGDDYYVYWAIAEAGERLWTSPSTLFEAPPFHPLHDSLAFSESMLSAAALVGPLNLLTGDPRLGHGLYTMAVTFLSTLGVYLLVRGITHDTIGALLAGLYFGLTPDRWLMHGHLAGSGIHWLPFVFLACGRAVERQGFSWHLAAALALIAHMHAGAYHAILAPFLLAAWGGTLLLTRAWPLRRGLILGVTLVVAASVAGFGFLPYLRVRESLEYEPPGGLPLTLAWYLGAWREPLAYVARWFASDRQPVAASPLPWVVLGVAAMLALSGLRSPTPDRANARRLRPALLAALAVTVVAALFSGPVFLVEPVIEVLRTVPGISSLRSPARFLIVATLGASIVLGIAIASIRRHGSTTVARVLTAGVALAVVLDSRLLRGDFPLTFVSAPSEIAPVTQWLADQADPGAVLHLPYGTLDGDLFAMMGSLHHRRRIMNGYAAFYLRFGGTVRDFPSAGSTTALAEAGVRWVAVDAPAMRALPRGDARLQQILTTDLPRTDVGHHVVFRVPDPPPPEPLPASRPLPPHVLRASADVGDPQLAVDGRLDTHWTTPVDQNGALRIVFPRDVRIAAIELRVANHLRETPPVLRVRAQRADDSWHDVADVNPVRPPLRSYRADATDIRLRIPAPDAPTRAIEVFVPAQPSLGRLTTHTGSHWGIHEIDVYPAPEPAGQ